MAKKAVYCPGNIAITGTDYSAPGHPRRVHEDGSLCDHPGGVRIGDAVEADQRDAEYERYAYGTGMRL